VVGFVDGCCDFYVQETARINVFSSVTPRSLYEQRYADLARNLAAHPAASRRRGDP
jgi:hypothetical protein